MRICSKLDLLAACLWAGAAVAAVAVSDSLLIRTALGAPMVFLVSGHTVLRAIGVRTGSALQHFVYAVGASLAAGIAGGFALNAAGSLTPLGWALWFWVVTVAAALVAACRRDTPDLPAWPAPARVRLLQGAAFMLALLVATGAYALAVRDEAAYREFKYTAFWLLPSASGESGRITVGIRSAETQTQLLDLEITLDGQPFAIFRSLAIAPGESWAREIPVPVLATPQKADARLYRPEDNRLYRSVSTLVPHI
ncbi:MAG: hypothetical protein EOR30_00110 [Mesorhizobium sp.]|uniref:hypothetical protein n=1 Tax=unclassified Mesorhizobium TaxID=325217 RepID=UPI000FC9C9B6|nr:MULTISPECIES: hypothetical protein [unclassified Mesorhizobium]RUV72391.1 hypothetical protein EOA78_14925 [Mesorhizobium sp. M5C.F.Cr.IN.023.01.1.1]RWF88280.1 MAG: hypothetical protein EOQ36_09175 [Mesorhizobium sp.]RWF93099.1 MAG: hypothetical protein EOQ45_18160 [Mesorhizobium sp.]RWI42350.1 MAG: hypothetical protein EOR14_04225 [Mesorhizobium sp.]RWI53582.1 MAG: hypothetical protein EOR15_02320 [Mesorhizobium sp.]